MARSLAYADDKYVVTDQEATPDKTAKVDVKDTKADSMMPVPEPSSVSLVLLGLGSVVLANKMRRRA